MKPEILDGSGVSGVRYLDAKGRFAIRCPKTTTCRANVCPLDWETWQGRTHVKDEPVCFYLREWAKKGSRERFAEVGLESVWERMEAEGPGIMAQHKVIRRKIKESARLGSSLGAANRLPGFKPAGKIAVSP